MKKEYTKKRYADWIEEPMNILERSYLVSRLRQKDELLLEDKKNFSDKAAPWYGEWANKINQALSISSNTDPYGFITDDLLWFFNYEFRKAGKQQGFNEAKKKAVNLFYAYVFDKDKTFTREQFIKENPALFLTWYPQSIFAKQFLPTSSHGRRNFLTFAGIGIGSLVTGVGGLIIGKSYNSQANDAVIPQNQLEWNLITPWNHNNSFSQDVENFAKAINKRLKGILNIRVHNELQVPPYGEKMTLQQVYQLLESATDDSVHMFHASPYYHNQKDAPNDYEWNNAFFFFSAIPYGLKATDLNNWVGGTSDKWYGKGTKSPEGYLLWKKLYEQMNVEVFPGGSTSQQYGGWWRLEEDLEGKQMDIKTFKHSLNGKHVRIMGFARKILEGEYNAIPKYFPSSDMLLQMYSDPKLVLVEWINPTEDMAVRLHTHPEFKYYCATPWNENSTLIELGIKKSAFEKLDNPSKDILVEEIAELNNNVFRRFAANQASELRKLEEDRKDLVVFNLSADLERKLQKDTYNYLKEWYISRKDISDTLSILICCSYMKCLKENQPDNPIVKLWLEDEMLRADFEKACQELSAL